MIVTLPHFVNAMTPDTSFPNENKGRKPKKILMTLICKGVYI